MLKINDANKFVRLKNDPSVSGLTTGNFRELPNNRYLIEIMAGNKGLSFYPLDQLELINLEAEYWRYKGRKIFKLRTLKTILAIFNWPVVSWYDLFMESTNTDFYPYQFKPVIKLINSPSVAY